MERLNATVMLLAAVLWAGSSVSGATLYSNTFDSLTDVSSTGPSFASVPAPGGKSGNALHISGGPGGAVNVTPSGSGFPLTGPATIVFRFYVVSPDSSMMGAYDYSPGEGLQFLSNGEIHDSYGQHLTTYKTATWYTCAIYHPAGQNYLSFYLKEGADTILSEANSIGGSAYAPGPLNLGYTMFWNYYGNGDWYVDDYTVNTGKNFLVLADTVPPDRGHRLLLENGLQIQATTYWQQMGDFNLSTWQTSNFTTVDPEVPLPIPAPGIPWGRVSGSDNLTPQELPYLSTMVSFQYGDEQYLSGTNLTAATTWLAQARVLYPNVLGYTNQMAGQMTIPDLQTYMQQAQPDMVMFDIYPFGTGTGPAGGSPTELYRYMVKYRNLGLDGNDGTGNVPIPYGTYLQTFRADAGYVNCPSDSEMRLNQFAAWTFGYTFVTAYVYDSQGGTIHSSLFAGVPPYGLGDFNPTVRFYQIAETNRQSRNLGPTLVRLLSTDIRLIRGQHLDNGTAVDNDIPAGMSLWPPPSAVDPYMTSITATNMGSKNGGLKGDVLVGYFKPLLEADDGRNFTNEIYFMITNGLSDPNGLVSETSQRIRIDFNFAASGITSLQRLNRDTGLVEIVPLQSLGGSSYRLDLTLDGGTGDLFKFNTGAPFIAMRTTQGTVHLQDYSGDIKDVGVTVNLRQNGVSVRTERMFLDGNGQFIIPNVLVGTYDVAVKARGWLQQVIPNVNVASGSSSDLGTFTLINGDGNGDNEVTGADLNRVLANMDMKGND